MIAHPGPPKSNGSSIPIHRFAGRSCATSPTQVPKRLRPSALASPPKEADDERDNAHNTSTMLPQYHCPMIAGRGTLLLRWLCSVRDAGLICRTIPNSVASANRYWAFPYDLRFTYRLCRRDILACWLAQRSRNHWNLCSSLPAFRADLFNQHLGSPPQPLDRPARRPFLSCLCDPAPI
jgi:hypothetical protein